MLSVWAVKLWRVETIQASANTECTVPPSRKSLVKISRRRAQPAQERRQVYELSCDQALHVAFPLPGAVDREQPRTKDLRALLLPQRLPNDDLDFPSLVLEADEDCSVRGLGLLAKRDDAGVAN